MLRSRGLLVQMLNHHNVWLNVKNDRSYTTLLKFMNKHDTISPNIKHSTVAVEDSYVKKFMKAIGWMDQSRTRLKLTGYFLYESVLRNVSYNVWVKSLNLPDTFATWFIITELHVWMLMVRYMAEDLVPLRDEENSKYYADGDGHFVRNCMVEALWADVSCRIKLLEGANPALAKKQVGELSEQFQAAMVAYDEGLHDDKVLAGAIWRRFYFLSHDVDIENIERIVHLIRHQIHQLEKISGEDLRWQPQIEWLDIMKH